MSDYVTIPIQPDEVAFVPLCGDYVERWFTIALMVQAATAATGDIHFGDAIKVSQETIGVAIDGGFFTYDTSDLPTQPDRRCVSFKGQCYDNILSIRNSSNRVIQVTLRERPRRVNP